MIRTIDPLTDPRWRELVQRDPRASAFHTPEWLDALRRTYGFVPVVYATDDRDVGNAIPFCAVASWLTGRRLVSLPFSDHCQPLVDDPSRLRDILDQVTADARRSGWRYVQIRPRLRGASVSGFGREEGNYLYALDLRPDLDIKEITPRGEIVAARGSQIYFFADREIAIPGDGAERRRPGTHGSRLARRVPRRWAGMTVATA